MKKGNKFGSKIIAVFLAVMMIASAAPFGYYAYADENAGTEAVSDADVTGADEVNDNEVVEGTEDPGDSEAGDPEEPVTPEPRVITYRWRNNNKDLLYETTAPEGETPPEFAGDTKVIKKASNINYTYKWDGTWIERSNADRSVITYWPHFIGTFIKPAAPVSVGATASYEKVKLTWKANSKNKGRTVYYEVRNGSGKKVKTGLTAKTYTAAFDPYPGSKSGKGTSGVAKKATFKVYSYVIHPTSKKKIYCATPVTKKNIEVIHPMYIRVRIKSRTKLYKSSSTYSYDGYASRGDKYIVLGGSRINGERKRVVVKVNGKLRYIKSSDVTIEKMWYSAKTGSNPYKPAAGTAFSKTQIENFINDKVLDPDTGKYVKLPQTKKEKWRKTHNYLIWVNTYHQRVYLFKWSTSAKKWVIDSKYPKGMLCNTGKELTPIGIFRVANKWAKKPTTGTKWWCIFHSIGIHEKLGDSLGKPASGGCVRIPDNDAYKFYSDLIKVGTAVYIY